MVVLIISIERFRGRLKFSIFIPHDGGKKTLISSVPDALTYCCFTASADYQEREKR